MHRRPTTPSLACTEGHLLHRCCAEDAALSAGSCLRGAELAWVASAMRALGQRAAAAGLQRAAQGPLTVALAACMSRALGTDQVRWRMTAHAEGLQCMMHGGTADIAGFLVTGRGSVQQRSVRCGGRACELCYGGWQHSRGLPRSRRLPKRLGPRQRLLLA